MSAKEGDGTAEKGPVMNTGVRITAFTTAVAATFAAAYGVGAATGPLASDSEPAAHAEHNRPAALDHNAGGHSGHADTTPAGLQVSQAGYTLDLKTPA